MKGISLRSWKNKKKTWLQKSAFSTEELAKKIQNYNRLNVLSDTEKDPACEFYLRIDRYFLKSILRKLESSLKLIFLKVFFQTFIGFRSPKGT